MRSTLCKVIGTKTIVHGSTVYKIFLKEAQRSWNKEFRHRKIQNKEITTTTETVQAGISTQQGLDSLMRQTVDMSMSDCLGSSIWSEKAFLDMGSAILSDRLNKEYKVN